MERPKTFAANAALGLVSLALAWLALEGVARWARTRPAGGKEQGLEIPYIRPDALLGWTKVPGRRVTFRRAEYTTDVAINSLGLRDPERGYDARGAFRMLALGDSFVEAYTVPLERTATQLLERGLSSPGCRVEVINAATAGYSTDQEYLFYLQEGERYEPRVIVVFFFYNDLLHNVRRQYWGMRKPLLERRAGALVAVNTPLAPPAPKPAAESASTTDGQPPGSALLHWIKRRLLRGAPRVYDRLGQLGLWARPGQDRPDEQLRVYQTQRMPSHVKAWRATEEILAELRAQAERRGARVLVAYVPARMEVVDRDWDLTQLAYGLRPGEWERGIVARRLARACERAGLPMLDLTPALRRDDGWLSRTYFQYDAHWTARGQRAVAGAVEEYLRHSGWLPACAASPRRPRGRV